MPTPTTTTASGDTVEFADDHYGYRRRVRTPAGTVRVHIRRARDGYKSFAIAEALAADDTWTRVVDLFAFNAPDNWFVATPSPDVTGIDPAAVLGTLAQELIDRATTIITACPDAADQWSDMDIMRALFAASVGLAGETWLALDHIVEANTEGHPLQIIRRPDGQVLITTAHAPTCPLITSGTRRECDDTCENRPAARPSQPR